MKKSWTILLIMAFVAVSCGNNEGQLKSLKKEVIDIHDEVMPEMGNLRKMQKMLLEKASTSDSLSAVTILEVATRIDSANEGMMDWMRNFDPDFEGTHAEKLDYLSQQKAEILKVKETMHIALDEGKDALSL